MKSSHLLKSSLLVIVVFIISCKQLGKNTNLVKEKEFDIIITNEGLFYKGQELVFESNINEWENILGKSREHIYQGSDGACYVWDKLGLVAETIPRDESQEWTKTKIKEFYIYYRNLDSQIGRSGGITDYGVLGSYRNIKPSDWIENRKKRGENIELSEEDLESIKYLNSHSQKKSEFGIPYITHIKPINIQSTIIDSTMNIEVINNLRDNKNLELANFRPAIGGVNNHGWEDNDTSGKFSGEYGVETEFKNNKKFDITFNNNTNQVIYIKIRKLSKNEIKEYIRYKKDE